MKKIGLIIQRIKLVLLRKYIKFLIAFYKKKNESKPKLLIYTDSRGYDVANKNGKELILSTYLFKLIRKFNVEFYICPEKHTTIVDFLIKIEKLNLTKYSHVILHCGVVDFSPRPMSNIDFIQTYKRESKVFQELFANCIEYHNNPFNILYDNEPTSTIYSEEYLKLMIGPKIKKIKNLIWVNSNNFVADWNGNYPKKRPSNINEVVNKFDLIFSQFPDKVIDLKSWNNAEIKKFTIDNIHFTKNGFNYIYKLIIKQIEYDKKNI